MVQEAWWRVTSLDGTNISTDQLGQLVQEAWWRVTPALCHRLADSMPDQLQEVAAKEGGWAHY